MSRNAGIQVRGSRQLRSSLRAAGGDLAQLKAAHKEAADIAKGGALGRVPVRTGKLRATVRATGTNTAGILRAGYARVPYAGAIHWGWPAHHIEANPFLSDGSTETQPQWLPVYENAVDTAIEQVRGI